MSCCMWCIYYRSISILSIGCWCRFMAIYDGLATPAVRDTFGKVKVVKSHVLFSCCVIISCNLFFHVHMSLSVGLECKRHFEVVHFCVTALTTNRDLLLPSFVRSGHQTGSTWSACSSSNLSTVRPRSWISWRCSWSHQTPTCTSSSCVPMWRRGLLTPV